MSKVRKRSLIYCRVSDPKQKTDGHGLESQELRCRQFAAAQSLQVDAVFHDDVTGGGNYTQRPAMTALLDHLSKNKHTEYVVIFDDIKRASRDVYFYWGLIHKLDEFSAEPMSPNFVFEQTPEGRFQQSITVAAGEYERESNARQTRQKMIARLESGYYVFRAPVGFRHESVRGLGKVLVRDEPVASVIAEALEGFASGRFQTKQEVKYFLEGETAFPKTASGKLGNGTVDNVLENPLYAGYVGHEPWGVSLRKGQHEGMVSYETFCRAQDRVRERSYAPVRKDLNVEFPLRGSVLCECGNAYTASMSRSCTGKLHAYYRCQNKRCEHQGKSIRRDQIEGDFEELLKKLTPRREVIVVADKLFRALWKKFARDAQSRKAVLIDQVSKTEDQIEKIVDRIVNTEEPRAIRRLEDRITKLENDKLIMEEKLENSDQSVRPYSDMYRTALRFLANPHKLWASERYEERIAVKKLVLTDCITYVRNEGYRTIDFSLPFKVLADFLGQEEWMVARDRIELSTRGFSVPCSTN